MQTVVITIGRLNIGGAELRLLEFLELLSKHNSAIRVIVYVVSGMPGVLDDRFRASGASIFYGKPGISGMVRLWQLCRAEKPSVLHINAQTAAGFYALAGLLAGTRKRIAHFHTMRTRRNAIQELRYRLYELCSNAFCTQFVGVSDGTKSGYLIRRPWVTIYNGIPHGHSAAAPPSPESFTSSNIRILVIGRIFRTKNIDRAISVFARFKGAHPKSELHIVGPYVDVTPDELNRQIAGLGLAGSVFIHPPTQKPDMFFANASLLLLTSTLEGLPSVVIEALAWGTPVVSTDLPGSVEIARQTKGVRCLSFSRSDEDWAKSMEQALTIPRKDIRESFGASDFTVERYTDRILELWNDKR